MILWKFPEQISFISGEETAGDDPVAAEVKQLMRMEKPFCPV